MTASRIIVLAILIAFALALVPAIEAAPIYVYVSANVEGWKVKVSETGIYRFMIRDGAYETCPPFGAPDHPEWWGWATCILIYRNGPVKWTTPNTFFPGHDLPGDWDYKVGDWTLQSTYWQAEKVGQGKYVDIPLIARDYVTLVVWDGKGFFQDNSEGVLLSVSSHQNAMRGNEP